MNPPYVNAEDFFIPCKYRVFPGCPVCRRALPLVKINTMQEDQIKILVAFGNWLLETYPDGKAQDVSHADICNFQEATGLRVYPDGYIP